MSHAVEALAQAALDVADRSEIEALRG
jgi:hypothetical protein